MGHTHHGGSSLCFCRFVNADIALTVSPLVMGRFRRQISRSSRRLAVLSRRAGSVYRAIKYYHHTLLLSMASRQLSEALFLAETVSALMFDAGEVRASAQVLVQVVRYICNRDDGLPSCGGDDRCARECNCACGRVCVGVRMCAVWACI